MMKQQLLEQKIKELEAQLELKSKVLIYVEGGNIQMVASSKPVGIVIVDRDEQDIGNKPVNQYEPDRIMKYLMNWLACLIITINH